MQVQVDGAGDGSASTPFNMYHPNQLQPQHQTSLPQMLSQPEQPAKPRAKAVGRREIARRAEACVQKAASTAAQPTSMPIRSPPPVNATLPSSTDRETSPDKTAPPATGAGTSTEHLHASFDKSGTATAAPSVNNDEPEPSAPASVHDDADDESELSELDEDEVEEIHQEVQNDSFRRSASIATLNKTMFPNLAATRSSPADNERKTGGGVAAEDDTIHVHIPGSAKKQEDDKMDLDEK